MQRVAIIGAGGHAREIADIFDAINALRPSFDVLGHLVESSFGHAGQVVRDRAILGDLAWLEGRTREVQVICGVGDGALRQRLARRAVELGARFCSAIHPTVIRSRWVGLGEGVVISGGSVLTNQIEIGDHVHINTACTIAHDDVVEDFATLSPGCHLAGNVRIREGAFLGIGVSVIPRIEIGAWATIGAGATVTRDIPAGVTAVGVPARVRPGAHAAPDRAGEAG